MEENQTLNQKKIALAQSEQASTVIELMKDCIAQVPLVDGNSQWKTIVNAITLDANSTMLRAMVDLLDSIRKGSLHEPKE